MLRWLTLLLSPGMALGQLPIGGIDMTRYREHFLKDDGKLKPGQVRVTFLGAGCLLFDDGTTQILTDAFFSRPPLRKVSLGKIATDKTIVEAVLKKAKIERLKAIFPAHSHYDHAFDVAEVALQTKATVYGSSSTLNIARGGDVPEAQLVQFEGGKEYQAGAFRIKVFKGKHSPAIPGINDDLGQTIDTPLKQPASFRDYKEGGSYDFLITHGTLSMYVVAGSNFTEGNLDSVKADVIFLGVGSLGSQNEEFQTRYYDQTVQKLDSKLVIPVHWDNFFTPLSETMEGMRDVSKAFDILIPRCEKDKVHFGLLQGFGSVNLPLKP